MKKMGIFFAANLHFCGVAKLVNKRGPREFWRTYREIDIADTWMWHEGIFVRIIEWDMVKYLFQTCFYLDGSSLQDFSFPFHVQFP